MSDPKQPNTADLLIEIRDAINGLRDDMRRRSGLPDVKIGKSKMRDWTGPDMEGKAASECPADFLLAYADFLEWKAGKNREEDKEAYAVQSERAALMCRRWAAVNRGIVAAPEKPTFRRPTEPAPDATQADPAAPKTTWSGGSGWAKKAG